MATKKTSSAKKTPTKVTKKTSSTKNNSKSIVSTKIIVDNIVPEIIVEDEIVESAKIDLIEDLIVNEIDYNFYFKKSNPFIFKSKKQHDQFSIAKNKKFKLYYNLAKFSIALLTVLFSIIALYFASIWQSSTVVSSLSFSNNKLPVGSDILFKLFNIDINELIRFNVFGTINTTTELTNSTIIAVFQLNIWDIKNSLVSYELIQVLFAFGIIGIFSSIFLLIFKNGTAWSISLLSLSTISFLIVFVIFILGVHTSMKSINDASELSKAMAVTNVSDATVKSAWDIFIANFNIII